jgi:uncharacterized protein YndB with AHSA1/START domain
MAPVELSFAAPPERVFEVLSDPASYSHWVVGSRSVGGHDRDFPARGSAFDHTQGMWPLIVADETEVVDSDPPRRLELMAKVRPFLVARVILELEPEAGGTRVRIDERAEGGLFGPFLRLPPGPQLIQLRNLEGLRRLRELAEP